MVINVLQFDCDNSQQDYQYIAKRLDTGEDVIGAVVVDKPLNASGKNYVYYILTPSFNNDSLHSMRFSRFKVDKDTIRPFTQSEEVAYLLSQGQSVELIEVVHETSTSINEKTLASLSPYDKIPYGLWAKVTDEAPEMITEYLGEKTEEESDKSNEIPVVEKASEPKKRGRKKKNP